MISRLIIVMVTSSYHFKKSVTFHDLISINRETNYEVDPKTIDEILRHSELFGFSFLRIIFIIQRTAQGICNAGFEYSLWVTWKNWRVSENAAEWSIITVFDDQPNPGPRVLRVSLGAFVTRVNEENHFSPTTCKDEHKIPVDSTDVGGK